MTLGTKPSLLCKDCRFVGRAEKDGKVRLLTEATASCLHESSHHYDCVTGAVASSVPCVQSRAAPGACGPGARHWRARQVRHAA